ncbi:SDR family oxidoreductase [Aliibacillus thermotolerans]|uniref:SDR family oxidoreductase n=1 Tax=Aliibacillus thermotolerans TaxID=1834418 RepID=A0ABW0U6U2_9BACI|nr:SDR family oxidoreductase [Aliibacillus thermotolerans]MDA3129085.1 SDR family NAD(P)-dependent oxidoreductase [Aliibacillus thermotolerans]
MDLRGKSVIITGASSGIGEATAFQMAKKGANVALAARREDRLTKLKERIETETDGKAIIVKTDVTIKEAVDRLAEKTKEAFGSIDCLVNNAGVMLISYMKDGYIDDWMQMIDVNIKGVLHCIHAVLPTMLEQDRGHIVNLSSIAGHEVFPTSNVYSATKYAVRALSMGLQMELSKTGIRVTNVSPGPVRTELPSHITDDRVRTKFISNQEKITLLEPEDIANGIVHAVTQPDRVNTDQITIRNKP